MAKFILSTENNADLPHSYYPENDIRVVDMTFSIDDVVYKNTQVEPKDFYTQIRAGKQPVTAQVSLAEWMEYFEPMLAEGNDVLNICFSSGLSGTCNSAHVAARELKEKYPDRKLIIVDSLCASMGLGLLVHKASQMHKSGASIDEVAQWLEENKLNLSHLVAVDDLMHLHRGGRLSKTSAVAGSLLGVKPIIYMNNEGKLENIDKIRGRRQVLEKIVDMTAERVGDVENDIFMISHSDCEEDANYVADLMKKKLGIKECLINFIGPVIGSHTGIGTIALFAMAKHR